MKQEPKKYYAEIYLLKDALSPNDWQKLYLAVLQYSGVFSKFDLYFVCRENLVRFFISSEKDLSVLSNNIDGMVLKPVEKSEIEIPKHISKERFVQFVTDGNFLDVKEKYLVKRQLDLEFAQVNVRVINIEKAIVKSNLYFKKTGDFYSKSSKTLTFFPIKLFAINFEQNAKYLRKTTPKYLNIEKSLHVLNPMSNNALFEVDTFPYLNKPYYLNIASYEFDKHSFIIGATGSGKSKFISLYVDRLEKSPFNNSCRVIIIDPHASLQADIVHIQNSKIINFNSESTQLFSDAETDLTAATELTATLFSSLLGDQFNSRLDRTLRFSLFVLFTAQNMSLDNLKRFLTDTDLRNQIIEHVTGYIPHNIIQFFGSDFNEIRTKYYNEAIMPIVALVDEMQLQPALVKGGDVSLKKTIEQHFVTVFSLNKVSMGEKTVKTVAGLLIQQIFLLAQARVFGQKIILIIDEVSIIQNPALASILAEARKFNLTVILTQQYFGQINKPLQDAIFANVYNYYVFRVSEEDARALEGNLNIELPKVFSDEAKDKGQKEVDIKVKMMTELNPRECLLRLSSKGQINPAIKAKTVDAPIATNSKHEEIILEKVELPKKFDEELAKNKASQPVSLDYNEFTPIDIKNPENQRGYSPQQSADSLKKKFDMKDLLAKHSSSRLKIRK